MLQMDIHSGVFSCFRHGYGDGCQEGTVSMEESLFTCNNRAANTRSVLGVVRIDIPARR